MRSLYTLFILLWIVELYRPTVSMTDKKYLHTDKRDKFSKDKLRRKMLQ